MSMRMIMTSSSMAMMSVASMAIIVGVVGHPLMERVMGPITHINNAGGPHIKTGSGSGSGSGSGRGSGSGSGTTPAPWTTGTIPLSSMCMLGSPQHGTCYAPLKESENGAVRTVACEVVESKLILKASEGYLAGIYGQYVNITFDSDQCITCPWAALLMDDQQTPLATPSGYDSQAYIKISDVTRPVFGTIGINLTVTDDLLFMCSTTISGTCCPLPPGGGFCKMQNDELTIQAFPDSSCVSGWRGLVSLYGTWTVQFCMLAPLDVHQNANNKQKRKKNFFIQAAEFAYAQNSEIEAGVVCV